MNAIKVVFLGEEYSFPQEVKKYIFYCHRFQGISDKFMSILSQRIKDRWYDFPDKEFDELFKQEGKKVIAYLAQDNIYDVTLSELIDQNKGYIYFQDMTQDGFEKWKQISINAVQEYARGYEYAQSVANSQITGSGMTLYSNSMLAHMTFAALESNTIKKQAMQADKEYRNAIARISRETQTAKEKQENEFLYKELFPAYADVIGMFVSELIEKYLDILYKHSIFDYPKAKAYDIQRSSELLNNLEVVKDKVQVLVQAFKNCPYNIEVYKKVVDLGLMDLDTFKTVQIFEQDDRIIDYIKSYCVSSSVKSSITNHYISVLSFAKNLDEKKIWHELYADKINCIVRNYQELNNALISDASFDSWIRGKICNDTEKLIQIEENKLVDIVCRLINSYSENELPIYINKEIISLQDIKLENSSAEDLERLNSEYCLTFVKRTKQYIFNLRKEKEEEKKHLEQEQKNELEQKDKSKRDKRAKQGIFIVVFAIILVVCIIQVYQYVTISHVGGEGLSSVGSLKLSEIVDFGNYDGSIEWVVVYDDEEGHLLLLTRQSLCEMQYYESNKDFSWNNCKIRNWLNSDFYNDAFSEEEKYYISMVDLITDGGDETSDKVFLLSEGEAREIFSDENLRKLIFAGDESWWLRSSSRMNNDEYYAKCINEHGDVYDYGYASQFLELGVHAAMWVDTTLYQK